MTAYVAGGFKFPPGLAAGIPIVTTETYGKVFRRSPHPRNGKLIAATNNPQTFLVHLEGMKNPTRLERPFFEPLTG